MELNPVDLACFVGFIVMVIAVSLFASRKEDDSEDYFLAGRNLGWGLIGISLIASCFSTEQIVGMSGAAYGNTGFAVVAWSWLAAVAMVLIALFLMPIFLKLGIYTMPEFLEHRYGPAPRTIMAIYSMVLYVVLSICVVLYSGALALQEMFPLDMRTAIWLLGIIAGSYTIFGGLKAVVWSDLLQGIALILGAVLVTAIGFHKVGGVSEFFSVNADKLHVIHPAGAGSPFPWPTLLTGIWIPFFFYWGFNQFITQRALGAKSLKAGQKGMMLAAALQIVLPFVVVVPGIMAFQLYAGENLNDSAFPFLVNKIVPTGLRGIMFAAIFGAVMSSLDSMLNSSSTIFTMDIYKKFIRPDADARKLMVVGRFSTAVFVVVACCLAPLLKGQEEIFGYLQTIWGYITPGIVAVFAFGLIVRRAPSSAAVVGLLLNPVLYRLLLWKYSNLHFLYHQFIVFIVIIVVMALITMVKPLEAPVTFQRRTDMDLSSSKGIRLFGAGVIVSVMLLYIYFW